MPEPPDLGLYLHVPFCLRKCPYCSFYSLAGRADLYKRYVRAVAGQIRQTAALCGTERQPLTSIFFGGGTPTMLPAELLSNLLAHCLQHFSCANDMEISIEVNPATVDLAALQILRQAGFNRLSVGVQSLHDQELQQLGRPYSAADALRTVRLARQAGFSNLSLDLMYGLPGQDLHSWRNTLEQALTLRPQHLSIYELTIEPGTSFAEKQEQGRLDLPDEDTVLLMLEQTRRLTIDAGFKRYEISNYARPGCRCRHNINYWQNGEYLGIGAGAVSFLNGTRCTALADAVRFCELVESGQDVRQEKESLDNEAAFRETVIMGLRMTDGVSLAELVSRFGINAETYYGDTLHRLIRRSMLQIAQGRLQLTEQGMLLANTVMAELV